MRRSALALAALLLGAAEPATLAECAAIDAAAARLACYDRLAGRPAAAEFGLAPQETKTAEPEVLQARLIGPFRGWERDTTFRLDNGQVWRAAGEDTAVYPRGPDNPAVTITRNWFGAYWMEVEGVGRRVKVKRVS